MSGHDHDHAPEYMPGVPAPLPDGERLIWQYKTILDEFYKVTFRKKLYADLESLQQDLDEWLVYYNEQQTHQGKMCCGRTPLATLEDGTRIWKEKFVGGI